MTKTRAQESKAAGQATQQGKDTAPTTTSAPPAPAPLQPPELSTASLKTVECASPPDILSLITADTVTISEEGKTIVNTIVKAVQLIINQKDQTIVKLQNHVTQLENRIIQLEDQVDEVNQYERRDTIIISGPNLPKEEHNENIVDKTVCSIKDNLHIHIEHKDISVAHRLGTRNTQNMNRPIIVKLHSRQQKYDIMNACVTVRPNLYINESLTPKRRSLFKKVWDTRKQHRELFQQCYTHDGKIYVKLRVSTQKHVITNDATLASFLDKYPVLKEATSTHINM